MGILSKDTQNVRKYLSLNVLCKKSLRYHQLNYNVKASFSFDVILFFILVNFKIGNFW